MDSIDIVDPTFALDIVDKEGVMSSLTSSSSSSSSSYLYLAGIFLLFVVGIFFFNRSKNKQTSAEAENGGFCTMNATIEENEQQP